MAQDAKAAGKGVAILDGKFVGPPFIAKAQKILKRHKLIEDAKK